MNQSHIIKAHHMEIGKVTISDTKTNENGGKSIYLNYDNHPIIIQTPVTTLPYNMSIYDKGDYPKYSIELSFRDLDTDSKLKAFHDSFNKLDDMIVEHGVKNSMPWFKKKKAHKDVVLALFSPHIKLSRDKETGEADGKYPPNMKIKLPVRDNVPGFKIYDFDKNELDRPIEELFVKGARVQTLIKCSGIWIIGGKFGCSWNVSQIMVDAPSTIQNYSFIDDSGGEEEEESDSDGDDLVDDSD
uniref:Uncharacterized protein n=1 Tax=viral metagenome TaxID=1070528 RepID=A0A6C0JC98_9ZZZZ|tara:strand:- start:52 stop:780 length:729 start_codon:yes stop_codon:yes gene_type:complete